MVLVLMYHLGKPRHRESTAPLGLHVQRAKCIPESGSYLPSTCCLCEEMVGAQVSVSCWIVTPCRSLLPSLDGVTGNLVQEGRVG